MASSLFLHLSPSTTVSRRATPICSLANRSSEHKTIPLLHTRRQGVLLLLLSSAAVALPARAGDIPLFGLRKKLRKIEEEAEEIVKEGEKAVEQGIVTTEKEFSSAEKEIEAAETGAQAGLVQAATVAAAEAIGVLVGVSVVNGILGPEAQKS